MACSAYKNGKCKNGFWIPLGLSICTTDETGPQGKFAPCLTEKHEYNYPLTGCPLKEKELRGRHGAIINQD